MPTTVGIVKNRFLQKEFKIFRGITGEQFEVLDKMRLIKKIVFVTDFGNCL